MREVELETDVICELYQAVEALKCGALVATSGVAVILQDQCRRLEQVIDLLEKKEGVETK